MRTLEDYIFEMENRSAMQHSNSHSEDIWTQLQQKENDLVLAAELGKALLEKNEELKKHHEATVEEYSKKLEVRVDCHFLSFERLSGKMLSFNYNVDCVFNF